MSELATLGGGCYWCLEAYFQRVKGVEKVVSGYSGGDFENPTSMQVYTMKTGHAEVVQLTFDPGMISYNELLEIFFVMHDPSTKDRQGNDVGNIYRSVILYHNVEQKKVAEDMIKNFAAGLYKGPIVTELVPYKKFWAADENMQDFYNNNPNQGYCMVIIDPKIQKLRQEFASKLK